MQLFIEKQIEKTMTFHADTECRALCQKRLFLFLYKCCQLSVTLFKDVTCRIAYPRYLVGTTVGSRLRVGYNYIG